MRGATYQAEAVISAKDRASKIASRISRSYSRMNKSISKSSAMVAATVAKSAKIAALAAGAGIGFSIREAARFEDKMADVRKVVDFKTPEGFSELRKEIIEMSRVIPQSQADLAEIAAIAGQAGTAQEDLGKFTELAAKSAIAFNMTAGDTADNLAQIREQLKLTHDELVANVDITNTLANNFNTSEAKLLDFNKRVAATGELAGFANAETQAFGTAMIAMGAESNVAATSFRNMTKALTAGSAATKAQKTAFKKLGFDAVKISKSMQKDAVGTVINLLEKLKELPKEAQNATALQLFGSEARALTPLLNNLGLLKNAIELASDAEKTAGAVDKEFNTRMETTVAQFKLFQNRLRALAINVGDKLLPGINAAFGPVADGIEQFVDFSVQKFEELRGFLDGLAQGFGFESTAAVLKEIFQSMSEFFDTSNGAKPFEAFEAGRDAAIAMKDAIEPMVPVFAALASAGSDFAGSMASMTGMDTGTLATLVAMGIGLKVTGGALKLIAGSLKLLVGIPLAPIKAVIKTLAALAGLGTGLGRVSGNLDKISKSSALTGGKKRGILGGAASLAKRHPLMTAAMIGGAGLMAFDNAQRTPEAAEWRRKRRAAEAAERQRQLNNVRGYDSRGMPIYTAGGVAPPQTGGGADQRDRMDPRTRFPKLDAAGNNIQGLFDLLAEGQNIKDKFDMTPGGKVSAEITGPVEAEIKGKADINVRVKVDGGRVTGTSVTSSGHVAPSVGIDPTAEPQL